MTVEVNVFNMQRQLSRFDDMDSSTLNWIENPVFNDDLDVAIVTENESFLINDNPEYDMFEFDDLCSDVDCLLTAMTEYVDESVVPNVLELKPLPDSLKYAFWGPMNPYLLL